MWESLLKSMDNAVRAWPVLIIAGICGIWAGLGIVLQALLIAMAIDVIAGFTAAFNTCKLNSSVGWRGVVKKVLTLLVVALAVLIENMLQEAVRATLGASTHIPIGETVTVFFIAVEGLSILENAGEAGVPIPKILRTVLEKLRQQGDEGTLQGGGA